MFYGIKKVAFYAHIKELFKEHIPRYSIKGFLKVNVAAVNMFLALMTVFTNQISCGLLD